jgi:hypothetical protein
MSSASPAGAHHQSDHLTTFLLLTQAVSVVTATPPEMESLPDHLLQVPGRCRTADGSTYW